MIKIDIGGCNTHHPRNFVIGKAQGSRDYLLIVTKSEAVFNINGEIYNMPLRAFVLFKQNIPYSYYNETGEYVNDWIHFSCTDDEEILNTMELIYNKPVLLYDITTVSGIISMAVKERYSDKTYSEDLVNHYMYILLYSVAQQIAEKADTVKYDYINLKLRELRSRIYNEPSLNWTVEYMCSEISLSASYFQHVYKSVFNISCIKDVINARIEKAKYYLLQTSIPIGNISDMCGYRNEMHFSRQFKKQTGMSPRLYREKMYNIKN